MYNLSKAKTKDQEELEELRRLLMEDQSKLGFMGKYGKLLANPYGYISASRTVPSFDATRVHQTMTWVVSFFISRPFGCSAQVCSTGRGS